MNTKVLSVMLVFLCLGGWVEATAQSRQSDEETVRLLDDQERIAALQRDVAALERFWSDEFTVNAPDNRVVSGKQALLDTYVRGGVINFSSYERRIEFIRADGDFVVIMGAESVQPISDAPAAGLRAGETIQRRFTNIWRREAGTWRLYWRHANVIPSR